MKVVLPGCHSYRDDVGGSSTNIPEIFTYPSRCPTFQHRGLLRTKYVDRLNNDLPATSLELARRNRPFQVRELFRENSLYAFQYVSIYFYKTSIYFEYIYIYIGDRMGYVANTIDVVLFYWWLHRTQEMWRSHENG